jgi:acyl-CoA reductase-like NAD-dependent aldehyde dehydrogenase
VSEQSLVAGQTFVAGQMFIGGEWRAARSGATFEATSPATGERIGSLAEGGREDAQDALRAASAAAWAWGRLSPFERSAKIHRVADLVETKRAELVRACTLDQGKPLAESSDEVDELLALLRLAAEDGVRIEGSIGVAAAPNRRALLVRRPRGVVACVSPWNWPYTMPSEVVAPALAAGNAVVWVPAPSTAWCSTLLADCFVEADFPPGVFNVVLGPGPVVGDEIVANPLSQAVAFIGSTATGLQISRRAAGKAQLLEMGGNGPLVVLADADLDAAVDATLTGAFLCAGQSCTAAEQILVAREVREAYVEKLRAATETSIRLGDPFDEKTTMGPLNNEPVAAKMDAHVADALARGATLVAGGQRAPGYPTDLYWQPTILDGVPRDAQVANEETFGPIAPVVEIDGLEDAVARTNASAYGLASAIFTRDLSAGLAYAERVRMGSVTINETTNYWESQLPAGGAAGSASGTGRVGGRHTVELFTELQNISLPIPS